MKNLGLAIENLSLLVDDKRIFSDLSLKINSGEIHVLIGPNGMGKSSLLKWIVGHPHYTAASGQLWLNKQEISTLTPEERARMGLFVAFQNPCEIEGLTVANFLRTALKNFANNPGHAWSATVFYQHLYALLDQVGLPRSFTSRCVHCGFSGGEKKRFELLQMLLFKPRFALLDELDSGLDVDAKKEVVKTIKQLQADCQTSFLVVSHDTEFIRKLSPNRLHLLKDGKLATEGIDCLEKIEAQGFINL